MPEAEKSLRDTLTEAFDADQASTEEHVDGDVSTEVPGDGGQPLPGDGKPGGQPAPGEDDAGEEKTGVARERDASGKFTKSPAGKGPKVSPSARGDKAAAKEPIVPGQEAGAQAAQKDGKRPEQPGTDNQAQQRLAPSRAPGSWRPSVRAKFATLDPEVQQEVLRRERDFVRGMTETMAAREFQAEFSKVIAPYQNIIAAEGGQPFAVINNLMSTAASLSHGSPMQKAQTAAAIIRNFGVDIQMLDTLLAQPGALPSPQQAQSMTAEKYIEQAVQNALRPLLSAQQNQQQAMQQQVDQDIETFALDPKNEFFEDVREDMADILEMAAKRGQKMDLQTAYNRAIMMHSEIAPIAQARVLADKTAQASAAAKAARGKAVSVTGAPAKPADAADRGDSLRSDILNAIDNLS